LSWADVTAYIASFAYFTNPDDLSSPKLIRISEGLLYFENFVTGELLAVRVDDHGIGDSGSGCAHPVPAPPVILRVYNLCQ
jgi:hypothetical protein